MSDLRASIVEAIKKNISYDATIISEGIICPHCQKVARPTALSHFLDHKSVLASAILGVLPMRGAEIQRVISNCLDMGGITGLENIDSETIADDILEALS